MKRIISLSLILLCLLSLFGCSKKTKAPTVVGEDSRIASKLEIAVELQKSFFIGKVLSVSEQDALIPKYNIDITTYTVYTVEVLDSLDGYTPLGQVQLYCVGTNKEFITRMGLKRDETYFLEADPWVYNGKVIYLLSIFTEAYPKIDIVNDVTLAKNETELLDCGTKEEYIQQYFDAQKTVEQKNPDFFDKKKVVERFEQIFKNIKEVNGGEWLRDFEYSWTPDEQTKQLSRTLSDRICEYIESLKQSEDITDEQIKQIFKMEEVQNDGNS